MVHALEAIILLLVLFSRRKEIYETHLSSTVMECRVFIKRHLLKNQTLEIRNYEISAYLPKQKHDLKYNIFFFFWSCLSLQKKCSS